MTINEYLQKKLDDIPSYTLTKDEEKMIKLNQLDEFILQKITSKRFKQNKLKPETIEILREKIRSSIKKNEPIYLIFGFGGYKNHWVEDYHPHIGWAEIFNLIYLRKLLSPILAVYEPGVIFEFESECEAVVVGNNYTSDMVETYTKDFRKLIEIFKKKYLPKNLKFSYITLREQYDTEALFYTVGKRVQSKIDELKKLPKEELESLVSRARFNLKLNGRSDLTKLSKKELDTAALESLAHNIVFLDEDYGWREDYFNGDNRIMTVGAYIDGAVDSEENPDNWITIKSCDRSSNAFWTSRGILQKSTDSFDMNIVGPNSFEKISEKAKTEKVSVLTSEFPHLDKIVIIE